MPYNTIAELPDGVKNTLPSAAQRIYMNAYNSCTGNDEKCAKLAWGAVKQNYRKENDTWVKKASCEDGYTITKSEIPLIETFNFGIIDKSTRLIGGDFSDPDIDVQKDRIMSMAIGRAVKTFMELPVITFNHTERPVGLADTVTVHPNHSEVICKMRMHDIDDVWEGIESGEYNEFSLSGVAYLSKKVCDLTKDCHTQIDDMRLDTITICKGGTAVNRNTFFTVISKALDATDLNTTTEAHKTMSENEPETEAMTANDVAELIQKAVDPLVESMETLTKANETQTAKMEEMSKPDESIIKADALTPITESINEIKKAMEAIPDSDVITKAQEEFDALKVQVKEIIDNPLRKAVISDEVFGEAGQQFPVPDGAFLQSLRGE